MGGAIFTEVIHNNGEPLLGLATPNADGKFVAFLGKVWALEAT
jgi:hypothetical protein